MYKLIAAASIGNALEWFDILIYGYFAVTISRVFFPTGSETVSLLLALGTFGAGYLVRPLGAIFLGAFADRAGRKTSLLASILLMWIGTLLTAIMPSYAQIGILAPIAVVAARLMQGFSVGGEFGSATAFLVEHTTTRKGFMASFQWAGQGLAAILASGFGIALTTMLTKDQLNTWGWRIPYIFGLLIGPVGFYIRKHVAETPEFLSAKKTLTPVRDLFSQQWDRLLLAIGAVVVSTSSNYIILYMPTYAVKQLGLPQSAGFTATLLGAIILTFGAPFTGHLSDSFGRSRILMWTTLAFLVTIYPAFALLLSSKSLALLICLVCWMNLLKSGYSGVLPAFLAECFPAQTRATGMSLSYNIGVPIFGGFAPFYITWMIALTGSNQSPSFYMIFCALIGVGTLLAARKRLRIR
jgi:MHS family proline/betaine transporter-like MFS transporter